MNLTKMWARAIKNSPLGAVVFYGQIERIAVGQISNSISFPATRNAIPGFFGPRRPSLFLGGSFGLFLSPGVITGGGSFGLFFGSCFCAFADTASPAAIVHIKINCFKNFIICLPSSLFFYAQGKTKSASAIVRSNPGATARHWVRKPHYGLNYCTCANRSLYKSLRFPSSPYEMVTR